MASARRRSSSGSTVCRGSNSPAMPHTVSAPRRDRRGPRHRVPGRCGTPPPAGGTGRSPPCAHGGRPTRRGRWPIARPTSPPSGGGAPCTPTARRTSRAGRGDGRGPVSSGRGSTHARPRRHPSAGARPRAASRPSLVCWVATRRAACPSTRTSKPAWRTRQKKSKSSSPKNQSASGSTPASTTSRETSVAPPTGHVHRHQVGRRAHRGNDIDRVGAAPHEAPPVGDDRTDRPVPVAEGVEGVDPPDQPVQPRRGQGEQADVVLAEVRPRRGRFGERLEQAGPEPAGGTGVGRQPDHADLRFERRVVEAAFAVDHHHHPFGWEPLHLEQGAGDVAGQRRSQVGEHHRRHPARPVRRPVAPALPRSLSASQPSSCPHGTRLTPRQATPVPLSATSGTWLRLRLDGGGD